MTHRDGLKPRADKPGDEAPHACLPARRTAGKRQAGKTGEWGTRNGNSPSHYFRVLRRSTEVEDISTPYQGRCIIAGAMGRAFRLAMTTAMWFLALAAALTSARYFLVPPRLLSRTEILALSRHHMWSLLHIAGGTIAITAGLFQFVGSLRDTYPRMHRATGYLYLSAVFLAGCSGLCLSPDTRLFAADGLTDLTAIDLSAVGLSPSFLGYGASSRFSPNQFFLVMVGFGTLALVWLLTSAVAFTRARQRRFEEHRAWMMRSYSLTFAAATVRLAGLPILVVTRNPTVAITCTFWSWILNLIVTEWLIRHKFDVGARSSDAEFVTRLETRKP